MAEINGLNRSHYAYCLYHACELASKLGIKEISAIEFGVAGGNGLLALEQHAESLEKLFDIKIHTFGFDTGEGLTPPVDHRDMPYFFQTGHYHMDVPKLKKRLNRSKLLLGDVKKTIEQFSIEDAPPIAAIMFDLDYYSSTVDAFKMFDLMKPERFLPRVFTYFDDVSGSERTLYNEHNGELLAIRDFNQSHANVKIGVARHLMARTISFHWYSKIFTVHLFGHSQYNRFISNQSAESLKLKD